ncbi:MAG: lytic transglycosylase domain-containing protein [Xanthomonadales bacterium]|nr:lytic transglycosylase domain-containing protein [Xanthomonadales bacterium]
MNTWKRFLFAASSLFFINSSLAATDYSQERTWFRQAWQAAARGQWQKVSQLEQKLGSYPLTPYLRAEQLSRSPGLIQPEEMAKYLTQHQDYSFHSRLQRQWLQHLAKTRQYADLIRFSAASNNKKIRCEALNARIQLGAGPKLVGAVQDIWRHGESLPKACDAPFRWLQQQGGIDDELALQRAELALNAGNYNLARYLKRFVNSSNKPWLQRWVDTARHPYAQLRKSKQWPNDPMAARIAHWGMVKLAKKEVDDAVKLWPALKQRFAFSAEQVGEIEREIALFRAVRLENDAFQWIDQLPQSQRDDQILAWRARVALSQENWQATADSIDAMASGSDEDRWQYWLGRSMESLGLQNANEAYGALAQKANYYGFLAADRVQQPYAICPDNNKPNGQQVEALTQHPMIERAIELRAVGLHSHARTTWRKALRGLPQSSAVAAAAYARDQGWTFQSIMTLAAAGATKHYDWRFPREHQSNVEQYAQQRGLDPALVYGIIRAESALRTDAISGAGARGLMQLMPATARQVARGLGVPFPGKKGLLQAQPNLQLGTAYFAQLMQRFTNSPMLAAGAYNAGPHIVDRWLKERPQTQAVDIWPEIIPYHETRDYIPNVLAYTVIYDWLMDGQVTPISAHLSLSDAMGQVRTAYQSNGRPMNSVACPTSQAEGSRRAAP